MIFSASIQDRYLILNIYSLNCFVRRSVGEVTKDINTYNTLDIFVLKCDLFYSASFKDRGLILFFEDNSNHINLLFTYFVILSVGYFWLWIEKFYILDCCQRKTAKFFGKDSSNPYESILNINLSVCLSLMSSRVFL